MAYNPASMTTGTAGVNHLATAFYDKAGIDNFKLNLAFYAATDPRMIPLQSGPVIKLFTYNLLAANTVAATEGDAGTGIALGTTQQSLTLNQYADWASFSDFLVDTAIDDMVGNSAAELGYRAGLTVDTLTSAAFDAAIAADSASNIIIANGTYMSKSVAQQAVYSLVNKGVKPKDNGMFMGLISPLAAHDLMNDSANGGTVDILKHTIPGSEELQRGIEGFRVVDIAGCRWIVAPTVPQSTVNTTNHYHSYVVGKDAVFSVNLGEREVPTGKGKNFGVNVDRNFGRNQSDPAGKIRGAVSYNFVYGATKRPGATAGSQALKRIQHEVSIS